MQKYRRKRKENNKLKYIKWSLLLLASLFFVILIFLSLMPKEPDMIKGVTYDLKYPEISHYSQIPRDVFERDFKLMKKAGINTIRLYEQPPEFILDLADKYNIKVIETIVFPGDWTDFTSPYQLQALRREAIRNINRDINRECIYAWSIWNDAPWTYGSGKGDVIRAYGRERVNDFLEELYKTVKKRDPLRPVTAATLTINEDAKSLGVDFLDILGYNIYLGITDWRDGGYSPELAKKMVDDLVSISEQYKKPVLITETGYSTYWTAEFQEDVIRDQIRKIGKRLKGIILFQWADDWSKAGNMRTHDTHIEEHWGITEGNREPKGGYYATKQMFSNTIFRNIMLATSEYFSGTYFATKKRASRKRWREDIIVDKEIEGLQNKLNLDPFSVEAPAIFNKLSRMFFERKGFDQFASYLEDYRSSYGNTPYSGLVNYYVALAKWNKLEYLAEKRLWELYYAEKTRDLNKVLNSLELAQKETKGQSAYLKVLYLEWIIHNDLLSGKENIALEKLKEEVKLYSELTGEATPLLVYSQLLEERGETQISKKMLHAYAAAVGKIMDDGEAATLLKEKAELALRGGDVSRAEILFNAYVNAAIRSYGEEEASFAMLELANRYKRLSLYEESIGVCERLRKEFPESDLADDAAYAIAVALKGQKSYSKAIKAFRDFILRFPKSDLSKSAIKETLSIFTVYGKETGAKKTISFLKEIVALYPDSDFAIMARFELASSMASLNMREEAMREYQYIIDNHPDSEYANYSKKSIGRFK